MSLASAGRFFTTEPQGKPRVLKREDINLKIIQIQKIVNLTIMDEDMDVLTVSCINSNELFLRP